MKKKFILLCLLSFAALLSAQNKNVLRITPDSTPTIALDKFWKFHNGDDSTWASPSFDDSNWDTINTKLKFDKDGENVFNGIAWFRIRINIDSALLNTPIYLYLEQEGASQLFLDGKPLYSFGKVSRKCDEELKYNPQQTPLAFQYVGEHTLAIRYSNHNYQQLFEKYEATSPGFEIKIVKQEYLKELLTNHTVSGFVLVALSICFFTLSFVHLLFFLFYKKQRTNLYYSVFVIFLGSLFLIPYISGNTSNPEFDTQLNFYFVLILPIFFYTLVVLEYSLFKRKRPLKSYFWFSTFALIVLIVAKAFWNNQFVDIFLLSYIISTVVASFFIVIKSIRDKLDGAWIIGTGFLFFLFFIAAILIAGMFGSVNINLSAGILSLIIFLLIILVITSIPISMSAYLARDFANTSKNLEKKLIEVETLSFKTIEQEKEKQKILETQKDTLEIQVKERTSEIVEQKKIIEEKNKDITDSIYYAKTIQEAILPTKELKNKLFPDCFILFKPKDIVSGDFYWFAEKNEKKIIASCDCTGHGVPGALMSMVGNNILNQIVNEKGITSPAEILNHLHKEIRKALKQEQQNETKDGMDISIITFNSEREIEFAAAQRPLWIVRNSENGDGSQESVERKPDIFQLTEIKGDKFAIGGIQSETERTFANHKVTLTKGDCIYIFTDGYADQFSDTDRKLMTSRFKEIIISIQDKPMHEQEHFLNDFIEKWKGNRDQIDDILVIGIRI